MITIRNFKIIEKLGSGSFSQVYKVQKLDDGLLYAMKRVKIERLKDKDKDNTLNEIRLLASISDPYIVQYKEAFIEEDTGALCIIMEYADNGDLLNLIKNSREEGVYLKEDVIWTIFIQILRGVSALHNLDIIHRDLKDMKAKIGDLNISKIAKLGFLTTQTGTPYYTRYEENFTISPEIYRDKPYDKKSDIWSLGVILYEMTALRPPFVAKTFKDLKKCVLLGSFQPIPKSYSEELFLIVRKMLQLSPADRPSAEELLYHPIVIRRTVYLEGIQDKQSSKIKNILMKTIKIRDFKNLQEALPKPQYDRESESSEDSLLLNNQNISKGRLQARMDVFPGESYKHKGGGGSISHLSVQKGVLNRIPNRSKKGLKRDQSFKIQRSSFLVDRIPLLKQRDRSSKKRELSFQGGKPSANISFAGKQAKSSSRKQTNDSSFRGILQNLHGKITSKILLEKKKPGFQISRGLGLESIGDLASVRKDISEKGKRLKQLSKKNFTDKYNRKKSEIGLNRWKAPRTIHNSVLDLKLK